MDTDQLKKILDEINVLSEKVELLSRQLGQIWEGIHELINQEDVSALAEEALADDRSIPEVKPNAKAKPKISSKKEESLSDIQKATAECERKRREQFDWQDPRAPIGETGHPEPLLDF